MATRDTQARGPRWSRSAVGGARVQTLCFLEKAPCVTVTAVRPGARGGRAGRETEGTSLGARRAPGSAGACAWPATRWRCAPASGRGGWGDTSSVSGGAPLSLMDSRKCFAFLGLCKFLFRLVERAS